MGKEGRVQIDDDAMEKIVGGVLIKSTTVTNKDTGEVYQLLVDPMTAFMYATSIGNQSDSDIIAGMLSLGYIS